ncbi:MAG: DNA mismatch repair endonuclease MutL [Polyangiaceae bacterium]
MAKVRKLPGALADQIAAGEVVERPASVVKELVENALDAGARRVHVAVDKGGVDSIRVTDDGSGMAAEDARLALERHATSKIGRIEDLETIATFGFRGEALPSIASVSKLTLVTRERGADEGVELRVSGGGGVDERPSGAPVGTTVQVTDLFFNVPARKKFLKSTGTEAAHVGEVVLLAALARPDVGFVLARDGRPAREYLPASSAAERVSQAFADVPLRRVEGRRGPFSFEGFLSAPEHARTGAGSLHLFVNARPVRDRALARAVAQAFGSVLEPGKYPVGVVYVALPPELVDVNVHPQKAEVRFADARSVLDAMTRELYAVLGTVFSLPALGPLYGRARTATTPERLDVPRPSVAEDTIAWSFSRGDGAPAASSVVDASGVASAHVPSATSVIESGRDGFVYSDLRYVGQVRSTFLVCEGRDGLYVLDQHAAAERVTFDRLRRAYDKRAPAMQRLLLPEVVDVGEAGVATFIAHEADILALGVEARAVGPGALAVDGVPQVLRRAHPERIVRDLLAELASAAGRPFGDAVDLVLATMACHGSVRAGDVLAREEAMALLHALDGVAFAGHCPHGRPVITRLSFDELERRVGRP